MASKPRSKLARIIARLRTQYGAPAPPPASNAFELVLWEKVAYLAPDERRARAFELLRKRVGLEPQDIIDADPALLRDILTEGGAVGVVERVRHIQDAAALVLDEFDGSLDNVLSLPLRDAKRALQRFYGIGEPGAEKILLLTRAQRLLPLDSNGARTLQRLGYGIEHKNYSTMYKSVRDAAAPELVADSNWLIDAHLLLRQHGQEVCKTSAPRCELCVLRDMCTYATKRRKADDHSWRERE